MLVEKPEFDALQIKDSVWVSARACNLHRDNLQQDNF
jgi:hypothetical protein